VGSKSECIDRESNPELGHGKTQCYRYTINAIQKLHIHVFWHLFTATWSYMWVNSPSLARRKPSSQPSTSGPYRVLITRRWTHRPRFVTLLPYLPAVIDVGATPVPIDYPTSNSVSVFLIFLKMEQSNDHGAFQNLEGILGQREIVFLAELVWASPWHYCSQQLWSDKVIPLYWSTISSLIDWLCWTRLFKVLRRFFNNPNLAFNPPH